MSELGDDYKAWKDHKRSRKIKYGIDCPGCKVERPKTNPTRLLPGQRCKVCGTYCDYKGDTFQREAK